MCASFHPTEDLVVSASLDKTVLVWDIGPLRKKEMNADLFGGLDATVKYVLQGHDREVYCASFHPTLPLVVSGAVDGQVKLWQMKVQISDQWWSFITKTEAGEVETLIGHTNKVSCVMFHSKQDIIVSNSEKSIRVWDGTTLAEVQTYRRQHDRFWILAVHPERNLLAAGHDRGMIVFKLARERPAFAVSCDSLFYTKDGFLRYYDISTKRDSQVISIRRPGTVSFNQSPRTLCYSPKENALLICSDLDGGSYELYIIPKDSIGNSDFVQEAKRGTGDSAVFISRNWFAILLRSTNQLLVKNLQNKVVERINLPILTDDIHYAGTGKLLCRSENKVTVFDLPLNLVVGELETPLVKYVVWSDNKENVALLSKYTITIASKKLVRKCTLHETIRVKSGAWDANGVFFIYTTHRFMKFCLPNGERGCMMTLDIPLYITKVTTGSILCFGQDGKIRRGIIDAAEYILNHFTAEELENVEAIQEDENGDVWEFGTMDIEGLFSDVVGAKFAFVEEATDEDIVLGWGLDLDIGLELDIGLDGVDLDIGLDDLDLDIGLDGQIVAFPFFPDPLDSEVDSEDDSLGSYEA